MEKHSFWKDLLPRDRYMVGNLFFLYLIQGIFVILIGSILPMLQAEYGLDYRVGGWLISAHSVGNLLTGLIAGLLPLAIGLKRSLLFLNLLPFVGFFLMLMTGNPLLLIFAVLLTGIGRGAISNYNNQVVSMLSKGSAAPLNMLHGFFAIGAVAAPFLVLLCAHADASGWRLAVYVVIALGALSFLTSLPMRMDSVPYTRTKSAAASFGFLKDRRFLHAAAVMFFYLCVEASVMGWMVTYYADSGVASQSFAQVLTSLLWMAILIGRFACSFFAKWFAPARMLRLLTAGIVLFLLLLLCSQQLPLMLVASIGLGLSLSGMYGTTVASAGNVFGEYPLAMGVFVTATGLGSVITPSIIGALTMHVGIRIGMGVLLVPALLAFALTLLGERRAPSNTDRSETA